MAIADRQELSGTEGQAMTPVQFEQMAQKLSASNGDKMFLSLNANPVRSAALITALVGTLFCIDIRFRTEKLREHGCRSRIRSTA